MTELLGRAFTEASKLPEKEENAMAALLLQELASEQRWSAAFASSAQPLAEMAKAALREFEAGKTRPMDVRLAPALTSPFLHKFTKSVNSEDLHATRR